MTAFSSQWIDFLLQKMFWYSASLQYSSNTWMDTALLWQKEATDKSHKSEESDVFRLDFANSQFHSEFAAERLILLKDI